MTRDQKTDQKAKPGPETVKPPEPAACADGETAKDCRENCMHCGYHCIYLKKDEEGTK